MYPAAHSHAAPVDVLYIGPPHVQSETSSDPPELEERSGQPMQVENVLLSVEYGLYVSAEHCAKELDAVFV